MHLERVAWCKLSLVLSGVARLIALVIGGCKVEKVARYPVFGSVRNNGRPAEGAVMIARPDVG